MRAFFEGIQYFFEEILFIPFDALAKLELENWWLANFIVWCMIVVLFVYFFYWLGQLHKFNKENTERNDVTSHSFFS